MAMPGGGGGGGGAPVVDIREGDGVLNGTGWIEGWRTDRTCLELVERVGLAAGQCCLDLARQRRCGPAERNEMTAFACQ